MGLILISDMHVTSVNPQCRTDNMLKAQEEKLEFLIDYANKTDSCILSAGDQTDRPRDFLSLWVLSKYLKRLKTEFYVVLGQHDKYHRSEQPSTMGVLLMLKQAQRLTSKPTKINGFNVYGCDFGDVPTKPEESNRENILVVHDMITTRDLAIKNMEIKDAEEYSLCNPDYRYIICGDIHRRFKLKVKGSYILNSGPMLRDEGSEYFQKYEPSFYFLDNQEIKMVKFPCNPDVVSRTHIKSKEEIQKVQFSVQKGENKDIVSLIKEGIQKSIFDKERLNEIIWGKG